ncbi:MAG: hypothetical protein JXK16_02860 [Thiotrichales bacterium]|nr:hypothetical protein [Thiotrichales bacterium]
MLSTLILGMILLAAILGGLWLGFIKLRLRPGFEKWNSREANKRMLQITLLIYFSGVVIIIYQMLNTSA